MEAEIPKPKTKVKKKKFAEDKQEVNETGTSKNDKEENCQIEDSENVEPKNEAKDVEEKTEMEILVEKPVKDSSKEQEITKEDSQKIDALHVNTILMKQIQLREMAEISHDSHEKKIKSAVIRPYTESQLAALYTNPELDLLETFNSQFIEAELKGMAIKQHHLYELLVNYLNAREKIAGSLIELEQLRTEYGELQKGLWTIDTAMVTKTGTCQDGTTVSSSHPYQRAIFHRAVFQSVVRVLGRIRKALYEHYVLYSYQAEDLRLQIESYIQTLIINCLNICQLNTNYPVTLSLEQRPHLGPYLNEIRLSISILFLFQRKIIKGEQFLKESRDWLGRLIGVLLRAATYQDHLFILNHILRCPAGVGQWAAGFVQIPLDDNLESPFASYQINHLLTILAAILSPAKQRDEFLGNAANDNANDSQLWIVVDSEGEEDEECGNSLRENDLVNLLSQLPLEGFFRSLLMVTRKNLENTYDPSFVNHNHILRFFSFSTTLIKILNNGLQTYNRPKYNQFCKRLSRFIRHVVQYATDQWEIFKQNNIEQNAMTERLQVEYDNFFLRAISYLYSSQKLGAWQFLAVVPYNLITIDTVWRIYLFLHDSNSCYLDGREDIDFKSKLWEENFRAVFEDKLCNLADDEAYYLLNTFANMALARNEEDMEFIEAATTDLLKIGFISPTTQEFCWKTSRTLLTHITSKHPHLLSNVLKIIQNHIPEIDSIALHLYEELPLKIWQLTPYDLALISALMLKNPISSTQNKLAWMILSRLNWDEIPYDTHCDVALLILRATNLDPNISQYSWHMICRLKLHYSDKLFKNINRILDPDNYSEINQGLRAQQPLAAFVALLMTTWGHLVPLICKHGFSQLLLLQQHQKFEAVLFALHLIVPLFLNSQEYLINFESFQTILSVLVNADRGYISMAKSLLTVQTSVLQQFGNMIETQIANYSNYDLDSPRLLVRLWLNALVSIPNWNKDCNILYLLDLIVRAGFFYGDTLEVVYATFRDLLQNNTGQESGGLGSIFKWGTNVNCLIINSLSNFTWLGFIIIEAEFEEREGRTGLWKEILNQLSSQKAKANVDNAIKKASSNLKLPSFSSNYLTIYRWVQHAIDTPIDHPLLPLLWQKFFNLYLARIPLGTERSCVGDKFFDGLVNFQFLKRVKKRLEDTLKYYEDKVKEMKDDGENKEFFENCFNIFRAYSLWLDEPRLQENNLMLQSLPQQYQPSLLALIFSGVNNPWYEYVDYNRIISEQNDSIKIWKIANFRYKTNSNKPLVNAGKTMESTDPVERILRRLSAYETPKPPPTIKNTAPVIPVVDYSGKDEMFKSLDACFKTLKQFAHNQTMKLSEHKALDCAYQDLAPQLYRDVENKVTKTVCCRGRDNQSCSGAAILLLKMLEGRFDERIDRQVQSNRTAFVSLFKEILHAPAINLCTASVTLQQCIKMLQSQLRCNPTSAHLGTELFYYILSQINEETSNYLPTKTLFASCIEKLGQSHICGVEYEMPRYLDTIVKEPQLGGYLAHHFSPTNIGTTNLLLMYSTISQQVTNYDTAFALLSKFDIDNWLKNRNPKSSQRSDFIKVLIKSLTMLGFDTKVECLMLHGLYRKHLLTIFEYQFPEHYGEILVLLLKASNGSDNGPVALSVWSDVLTFLSKPFTMNAQLPLRDQFRQYAQNQKLLQHQELLETADLFAKHFTQERLQYGLYGLYPKCRNYIDIFVVLLGMNGHALIISMINTHQGVLGDTLIEKIWPYLINMFTPWIVPYSMHTLKENMANWIQQLADDRSVLLPWITADGNYAQKLLNTFYECLHFLITTLPASGIVFSFIWQWYVTSFAHNSIKDYILSPIHRVFIAFPWQSFWPSIIDVELMLRVVDQYLPECHSFLGQIFMQIHWPNWLRTFDKSPTPIRIRAYQCLFNLLIKLSNEPSVRERSDILKTLLAEIENFDWTCLETQFFGHVIDWYVLGCDARVIFKTDPLDLEFRVLSFIRTVSGYAKPVEDLSPDLAGKRLIYVKTFVKLLSVFSSKHKNLLASKENDIKSVIMQQLKHLDHVVTTQNELNNLLRELINLTKIEGVKSIALKSFSSWIQNKAGNEMALKSILRILGPADDLDFVAEILEITLSTYFENIADNFTPTWSEIKDIFQVSTNKQLEQILLDQSSILTLTAIILRKEQLLESSNLLNVILKWLQQIKVKEENETKIPLLWWQFLKLSLKNCPVDEQWTNAVLNQFSKILLQSVEDKGGSKWGRGFLSAMGLTKQELIRFKFLCHALAGYVLAQLPSQNVRYTPNAPSKVGQSGGNTECVKVLLGLDFKHSQGKMKDCAELALKEIQDSSNSLHNATSFLSLLLKQFYMKTYLKDIS